jgi:hypothetical protein
MDKPDDTVGELSRFTGTAVASAEIRNEARNHRSRARSRRPPSHDRSLRTEDIAEIDKIAGEELRRLGYAP